MSLNSAPNVKHTMLNNLQLNCVKFSNFDRFCSQNL